MIVTTNMMVNDSYSIQFSYKVTRLEASSLQVVHLLQGNMELMGTTTYTQHDSYPRETLMALTHI